MVPNIDMNAIVSSAVFQPDSWSAFSFYESTYVLGGAQGGTLSVVLTLCLVGGRRLRQSSCSASVQGM